VRLIVVRHGETVCNVEGRFTGQTDSTLSPRGEQQTLLLGKYLARERLDVIVSSDLQRCRTTAQAIAYHHGLPVQEDADLREISLGTWEGRLLSEVYEREPDLVALWQADPLTYAPQGGETLVQLHERIVRALERCYTRYSEATVVWVTHGSFIGVLICHMLNIDIQRRQQFRRSNASITEFLFVDGNLVKLVRLNETAFLHV